MRPTALLFVLTLASSLSAAAQTPASRAGQRQSETVPPMSWTCPMHPEILEDKRGTCPICKMDLVPIRLDSVWTCRCTPLWLPNEAGQVPDRRHRARPGDGGGVVDLPRRRRRNRPIARHVPGRLADGQKSHAPRAHGNHNPQHGGAVLHGVRQLASPRGHVSADRRRSGCTLRRLHQAAAVDAVRGIKATLVVKDRRRAGSDVFRWCAAAHVLQAQDRQAAAAGRRCTRR